MRILDPLLGLLSWGRGAGISIIAGAEWQIFIYSCSQTVKTIDFKRN
jgi:hypothetical protein